MESSSGPGRRHLSWAFRAAWTAGLSIVLNSLHREVPSQSRPGRGRTEPKERANEREILFTEVPAAGGPQAMKRGGEGLPSRRLMGLQLQLHPCRLLFFFPVHSREKINTLPSSNPLLEKSLPLKPTGGPSRP